MHNILNTLWEWTEGSSKTDFGPAKAVGRSQTRPVEFLGVYFFILVFMTIRALNFILLFVPQLVQHN